jgi:hypothetical protein
VDLGSNIALGANELFEGFVRGDSLLRSLRIASLSDRREEGLDSMMLYKQKEITYGELPVVEVAQLSDGLVVPQSELIEVCLKILLLLANLR